MVNRWILKEITIAGFRGFIEPKTFLISEPFILFDGPQRSGKSSTLVAIEWGLFGDEIAKKGIGIDERRDWKVRNTNADEARVEMVLQKGQDILKIVRSDKKKKGTPSFYFELNGNRDTDEGKLRAMLGIQPKDFFSSVHLHQEIIRALLTEEPRVRRDSLDRLLGLSELRNIIDGIKLAKISETLNDVDNKFGIIETKLNAVITSKRTEIQKAKETGIQKGLTSNDFSENSARRMCETVTNALVDFASQSGLFIADLPLVRNTGEQQIFATSAKESLRKLRDEHPNLRRQRELLEKQSQLQMVQNTYKVLLDELQKLDQKRNYIHRTDGNQEKLQFRISNELSPKLEDTKNRRNEIDKRAGTIEEAIKYFEAIKAPNEKQSCPVCEKPIDDVTHLQMHLNELRANLDEDLAPIREEIKKYEKEIEQLEDLIKSLDSLDQNIAIQFELLRKHKSVTETALEREIKDTEDPIVILGVELDKIQEDLQKLETAVKESNQRLNVIEDHTFKLELILRVLTFEDEINDLMKIIEKDEYKEVKKSKLELDEFAKGVDLIRQAIETILQKSAKAKLEAAKESIAKMFRTLANRSDFPDLEIDPDSFEILAIKGSEKVPALSIFNTGDLNCAGLSVFLGLGVAQELSHSLGFIILDDPSQSLDDTHIENLVSILNSIPDDKQVLISTSESDLKDLILSKIIRKKKRYKFDQWSDIEGAKPLEVQ
ncbi:MAG: AAA family ATPase [Proteobacteria bacterium]|nr:AAA family ATPase [Pseudomonadota bacterium]